MLNTNLVNVNNKYYQFWSVWFLFGQNCQVKTVSHCPICYIIPDIKSILFQLAL